MHVLCVGSTEDEVTNMFFGVFVSEKTWSEWYNSDRPTYGQGVDDETLERISLVSTELFV